MQLHQDKQIEDRIQRDSFLKQPLPEALARDVRPHMGDESDLLLAMRGDMLLGGDYGTTWLLMNADVLGVFSDTGELLSRQEVERIDDVEIVPGIGTAVVEATLKDAGKVRLLRVSNACRQDFGEAARMISDWVREKRWDPSRAERRSNACPRCKKPLPRDMSVCPKCMDKGLMLRKVLRFLKPYKLRTAQLIGLLTGTAVIGLVNPYLGKVLVDDILGPLQNQHLLVVVVLVMIGMCVAQNIVDAFACAVGGLIGNYAVHDIRSAMFSKLQELSLSFYSRHRTGALVTRVNQDTQQLQDLLVDFIPYGVYCLVMASSILALLFWLSWPLTLCILAPVVGMVLFVILVLPRFRTYWDRYMERRSRLSAMTNDVINGVRVVKAFAQEAPEKERFQRHSEDYRDAAYDIEVKWARAMPVLETLAMMGAPIVWLVGGLLAFRGSMTLGEIVAYLGYLTMFFHPVFVITRLAQAIPNSLAAASRIFEVIDAEPEIADQADAVPMPHIDGRIEFRGVGFGYDGGRQVLSGIDLDIAPREMIGLVGHSGAGKSTFINVLCRFFDVEQGQILIDGVDLRQMRYEDLRRQVGIVLQETYLFGGSIAANIAYARPDAGLADIVAAARTANAHEFIVAKPDGYDTEVTEGGSNLSGGEKQRLAIARAVLCDPRILILDEATASIDAETEQQIQEALARLTSSRTTIAIAHRLSTLKNANRLLVLDKGKVAELGPHAELMAQDGIYARMVKLQTEMGELHARGI